MSALDGANDFAPRPLYPLERAAVAIGHQSRCGRSWAERSQNRGLFSAAYWTAHCVFVQQSAPFLLTALTDRTPEAGSRWHRSAAHRLCAECVKSLLHSFLKTCSFKRNLIAVGAENRWKDWVQGGRAGVLRLKVRSMSESGTTKLCRNRLAYSRNRTVLWSYVGTS